MHNLELNEMRRLTRLSRREYSPSKDLQYIEDLLDRIGGQYHGFLTDLAKAYGVTRERTRQVIAKLYAAMAEEAHAARKAAVARLLPPKPQKPSAPLKQLVAELLREGVVTTI
jgi:hypothetical protein